MSQDAIAESCTRSAWRAWLWLSTMAASAPPATSASSIPTLRPIARRAFSRVAGAQLSAGNAVELLIDGHANYAAWLAAIRCARSSILFENYIFGDDEVSRAMRDALVERPGRHPRVPDP